MNKLKYVVRKFIEDNFPQSLPMLEDILLVSARTGDGMQRITDFIISAKNESKMFNHSRYSKHFYVMGYANTGKSSFINALSKAAKRAV